MTINDMPFFRLILGYPHAQILENMFKTTDVHRQPTPIHSSFVQPRLITVEKSYPGKYGNGKSHMYRWFVHLNLHLDWIFNCHVWLLEGIYIYIFYTYIIIYTSPGKFRAQVWFHDIGRDILRKK